MNSTVKNTVSFILITVQKTSEKKQNSNQVYWVPCKVLKHMHIVLRPEGFNNYFPLFFQVAILNGITRNPVHLVTVPTFHLYLPLYF